MFGMHPMEMMIVVASSRCCCSANGCPRWLAVWAKDHGIQKGVRGIEDEADVAASRRSSRPSSRPSRRIRAPETTAPKFERRSSSQASRTRFDVVRSTHRQTPDKPGYFSRSRFWFACPNVSAPSGVLE